MYDKIIQIQEHDGALLNEVIGMTILIWLHQVL